METVTTPRNARSEPESDGAAVLEIRGLLTRFPGEPVPATVVNDVSLSVRAGETLAVVGESGSGKTMTFVSAMGLVAHPGRVIAGEALLSGIDLLKLPAKELRKRRGAEIAMVFQDPLSGLNPVFRIGDQIMAVIRAHRALSRTDARKEAVRLLERVHIPDAGRRVDDYPHQLSGGMRQRALIAMAIALGPKVLIADEPTTALDVTVQAQILELLSEIQAETGMAMVLITHDLGLVARHADRVAVMYGGRVVEQGALDAIFKRTRHPYTVALFRSIPHLDTPADSDLTPIQGQPPNPSRLPKGCAFAPRCYLAQDRRDCLERSPTLAAADSPGHLSACHHWHDLAAEGDKAR
ncbi:MAG: ABC transporter ATP-binding protein [Hyphomicrobiaceae bacterium]